MDQQALNDLLEKEEQMDQARMDEKDKIKKMQTDITNATDAITRKKLQLQLANELLNQQKMELDYEILQNQKRLIKLEGYSNGTPVLEAKDPMQAINDSVAKTNEKIKEHNDKIAEIRSKLPYEKGKKKDNLDLDVLILQEKINKLNIDLKILGYKEKKVKNSQIKEDNSLGCRGVYVKNEDLNGYSHRFIPLYRGVKTIKNTNIHYKQVEDFEEMSDKDVRALTKENYKIYRNLSEDQRRLFVKEVNDLIEEDDVDDFTMIQMISAMGIKLYTNDTTDNEEVEDGDKVKQNYDGSVGSIYDNIDDYVGE